MIRCDQYKLVHKGVYNVQFDDGCVIKKRSNSVDGKFWNPKTPVIVYKDVARGSYNTKYFICKLILTVISRHWFY